MLKITVRHPNGNVAEHSFGKTVVTLGGASHNRADVLLPVGNLKPEHLKIEVSDNHVVITNIAQDPCVLINDQPLTTAPLKPADVVEVGDITLSATWTPPTSEDIDVEAELKKLESLLVPEAQENTLSPEEQELADLDLDNLFHEVMAEETPSTPSAPAVPSPEKVEVAEREDVKDIVLEFCDEEPVAIPSAVTAEAPVQNRPTRVVVDIPKEEDYTYFDGNYSDLPTTNHGQPASPRRIHIVAVVILAMTTLLALGTYLTISSQNNKKEILAAQTLSDVSMAFLHAQATQTLPPDGHWTDAEFLDEHLSSVLASKLRSSALLDAQGNFTRCPYKLHMSLGTDKDTFFLVAEPLPSLLQWVMPKSIIFLDASSMQLWKTKSPSLVKDAMHRGPADGVTPFALLCKKSQMMPLALLNTTGQEGFNVPKGLMEACPDAVTRVYNAPRYYRFTKALVEAAAAIGTHVANGQDLYTVSQEAKRLTKLHNIVLYSYRGREAAVAAAQGLRATAKDISFYIAYMELKPEDGSISTSYILKDQDVMPNGNAVAAPQIPAGTNAYEDNLFSGLMALADGRRRSLQNISDQIVNLVQTNNEMTLVNFRQQRQKLLDAYEAKDKEEQQKIKNALSSFYQQWRQREPPPRTERFVALVTAAQLAAFLPTDIKAETGSTETAPPQYRAEFLLKKIATAKRLSELDENVRETTQLLGGDQITNVQKISLRNSLKGSVLDKIRELLLSPNSAMADTTTFVPHNRAILNRILTNADVGETEEKAFFLHEFDLLVEKYKGAQDAPTGDVRRIAEQLKSIPLEKIATSNPDDARNYGRMGQQILVREAGQPPSGQRDDNLLHAIELLGKSTDDNRSYWQDIIEARRLLVQTPQKNVLQTLSGTQGFIMNEPTLFVKVATLLNEYVNAASAIANVQDPEQYAQRYDRFRDEQTSRLKEALQITQALQQQSRLLESDVKRFVERLQALQGDYELAKEQGLFVNNSKHAKALSKVKRTCAGAEKLYPRISGKTQAVVAAAQQYEGILRSQVDKLTKRGKFSPDEILSLEHAVSAISYPNLAHEDFVEKLSSLTEA